MRIYWKILEAGKHIIDNFSAMYLFDSLRRLSGCVGTEGVSAPSFYVAPEASPKEAPKSVEELWALVKKGAYGKKAIFEGSLLCYIARRAIGDLECSR